MKRWVCSVSGLLLTAVLSLASPPSASADVGPAPSCPSGTHSAYLYGRRCVKDGYHLVQGPDGQVSEAPDVPAAPPSKDPTPSSPEPTKTPDPPRQVGKSGGCSAADSDIPMLGTTLLAAGLLGLALALRRRRENS
ncbi:MAG TPA: MYXO-CTERM sorting domain-containing protein [Pseudomonadota bacterium]|nr:MYXO-CTERM sorting domain-containing protein [Pseudomonadota bacterium]HNI58702.1 MYXO-CTERM sorting domain-containing protein [Pseudomonadota bacterium]HNK44281.1 MYXO-CTERM sorting domain-containing protein [Pseudomonadota bacterium]